MTLTWLLLAGCTADGTDKFDTGQSETSDTSESDTGDCSGPYAELFDQVWDQLQETYPYFELKGVDWHAQRAECRPDMCSEDMTSRKFFNRGMDCLLSPLADYHVYLIDTEGEAYGYGVEGYTPNYSFSLANGYLDEGGQAFGTSEHVTAGTISGTNILYVRVESWADVDDVDFHEILALQPDAGAFVIDVRANSGGNEGVAQRLAGAVLGAQSGPYSWAQYRDERDGDPYTYELTDPVGITISEDLTDDAVAPRPIALLTGHKCMSSCEGFVSMMASSPLTRSFGSTTRGSTGNPGSTELADGTLLYSSRWYLTRADGVTPVEWRGISPDEEVAYTGDAGSDEVLDAAMSWLATQ